MESLLDNQFKHKLLKQLINHAQKNLKLLNILNTKVINVGDLDGKNNHMRIAL